MTNQSLDDDKIVDRFWRTDPIEWRMLARCSRKTYAESLSPDLARLQRSRTSTVPLLVHIVHVLAENFVHREHMYFVLFEYSPQGLVAADHALVSWILQFMSTDVCPNALNCLRARELSTTVSQALAVGKNSSGSPWARYQVEPIEQVTAIAPSG